MEMAAVHTTHRRPRLIIHGGAGNITRANLPPAAWAHYRESLLTILRRTNTLLHTPGTSALDAATYAVTLLEDNPLFNASHGAVFTRDGTTELEASVMVSRGKRKRGCGVMLLKRVKHPILLAKEMLLRGEDEDGAGGGAYHHVQLSGATAESLAEKWGLEMVEPGYFWTRKRWEEHMRGLEREAAGEACASWHAEDYVPQGTVGAVAIDADGTLCVATSTGGLTNKLAGRIGDTPTFGAGFWAGEWEDRALASSDQGVRVGGLVLPGSLKELLQDCLPVTSAPAYLPLHGDEKGSSVRHRAVAMSGTGNGDSFLRLCACHTAASMARFGKQCSLQEAVTRVAGPGGELQASAGDRWGKTGEGEGGIIGIEKEIDGEGRIVADFNCGGMFRVWIDDEGVERCKVFRGDY